MGPVRTWTPEWPPAWGALEWARRTWPSGRITIDGVEWRPDGLEVTITLGVELPGVTFQCRYVAIYGDSVQFEAA